MGRLGPFEKHPTIAVAVSGGADSMALAILANRWVRRRRGKLVALTVDHGLRPGSRAEALEAHERLKQFDIACHLLTWRGDKPASGIQAAAREARYRLMAQRCCRLGILHLLVAHHREDQAETMLHRLGRSSGVDGLAGMASINELPDIRLLRPCLSFPRDRLRRVLQKFRLAWAEDPSNQDAGYARVRLRSLLPALASEGITPATLTGTAHRMAAVRRRLEAETACFLSAHAALYPEGYAMVDRAAMAAAEPEVSKRVLMALSTSIGGNAYPPRYANLAVLWQGMCDSVLQRSRWRPRTLAGCRIIASGPDFLICREAGRCEVITTRSGSNVVWDSRFSIRMRGADADSDEIYSIKSLGETGWAAIGEKIDPSLADLVPKVALFALPAFYIRSALVAVPHLEFYKDASVEDSDVRFMPAKSVTSAGFPVV